MKLFLSGEGQRPYTSFADGRRWASNSLAESNVKAPCAANVSALIAARVPAFKRQQPALGM